MTTKVTVDAHAGWPVKVEAVETLNGETKQSELAIVPPFEKRDFYVFDTRQLLITEMKKTAD